MNDQNKTKAQLIQELTELRRDMMRYRSLFEHSPISLWEADFSDVRSYVGGLPAAGVMELETWLEDHPESVAHCVGLIRINRVNQATLHLFKASDEAEVITNLSRVFDDNALAQFLKGLIIALIGGEVDFAAEVTQKTLNDDPLNTIVQVSIAPGHEENWGKVFVSILDITGRVRAENARRDSENRFQTAFRTSPDSININRLSDGLYIDINEGFTALTGFTRDDIVGKTSRDINVWANYEDRDRLIKGLRETGHVPNLEAGFRFKDGTVRTGLMSARIIQFGGELCILSITRDITQRKMAEAALRESEANYRVLVENSPDFIVRFDTAARVLFANTPVLQGLEKSLGLKEEAITGKTYREIGFSPAQCDFWEEKIQSVCESGEAYETEYEYETPQGLLVANWRLIPELDEQGKTKSVLSLSRDITERKRLETEFRKAEVLSAELKKEKEIVALKERFISTVTHEFRTPLSVIKTASDLLSRYFEKLLPERRCQLLQQINDQIIRLTDLIDDTLDLTRAQAGRTEFNPLPLELEPFCRDIFDQFQFASGGNHRFEFYGNAPHNPVKADGRLLQHILANLLSNAVKYAPPDTRIRFELDHNAHAVIFRIADEGIGIPEKDQVRLFEPFHRAENVGNVKGTGLGLAIVKQYVELHEGYIEVESQEGKGSTFSVFLPIT